MRLCQVHNHPLTIFRMNTYEKQGDVCQLLLTRNPKKDFYHERPSGVKDLSSFPKRIPVLSERSGMGRRGPLPEFFVGSFFGRGFASGFAFEAGEGVF